MSRRRIGQEGFLSRIGRQRGRWTNSMCSLTGSRLTSNCVTSVRQRAENPPGHLMEVSDGHLLSTDFVEIETRRVA